MHEALQKELRKSLQGRLTLDREIGRSAYGTVFLARDAADRSVALKVISQEIVGSGDRQRILRELALVSRLSHPHVLPVLDSGEAADLLWYSMPFIKGGTLRRRLKVGPLPLAEALGIGWQVAEALAYAHSHGVLHRDVTPRNVFLEGDNVLVKEFWIARALSYQLNENMTEAGRVVGTPGYMSPEQLSGTPVDSRGDVYSLGVLIFEMLTNRLPFVGATPMAIIQRQLKGGLSLGDFPPEVPREVAKALLKALAPDRDRRFQSPQELVDACVHNAPVMKSMDVPKHPEPEPKDFVPTELRSVAAPVPVMASRPAVAPRSKRYLLPVAAAVLIAGAIGGGLYVRQSQMNPGPVGDTAAPVSQRPDGFSWTLGGAGVIGMLIVGSILVGRRRRPGPTFGSPAPSLESVRQRLSPPAIDRLRSALRYQYEVEREIARGGMAVVYVARDLRYRGRKVAVKVLRAEYAATVTSERFLAEIDIMARLNHPGILPLFDSGDADGRPFYVMPFVEGETLAARIQRDGRIAVPDALALARDVGRALDYAHRQQIVHRDIKPENILLYDGQATVTDFGIALALDRSHPRHTFRGISLGTPDYMSPEQFWDTEHIDHRSDIYSLGCTLYQMLTGVPPYQGARNELPTFHLSAPIPHARSIRAEIPEHVDGALCRSMAKDPAHRFQSAAEFVAALANG